MAKTTKLGLNLTEDESTSFEDWRKSIDGNTATSNMKLIDDAMPLVIKHTLYFSEFQYADGTHVDIETDVFNRKPIVGDKFYSIVSDENSNVYAVNWLVLEVGESTATCYIASADVLSALGSKGGTKLYKHVINNVYTLVIITTRQEAFTTLDELYNNLPNDYGNEVHDGFVSMYNKMASGGYLDVSLGDPNAIEILRYNGVGSTTEIADGFIDTVTEL